MWAGGLDADISLLTTYIVAGSTSHGCAFLANIDKLYNDICECLVKAISEVIPSRNRRITEFNIAYCA